MSIDRLLHAEEVAEILDVKLSWVREATRQGKLPAISLGKYRRYDRRDILQWIEEQKLSNGRRK